MLIVLSVQSVLKVLHRMRAPGPVPLRVKTGSGDHVPSTPLHPPQADSRGTDPEPRVRYSLDFPRRLLRTPPVNECQFRTHAAQQNAAAVGSSAAGWPKLELFVRSGTLDEKRASDAKFAALADFLKSIPTTCPDELFRPDNDPKSTICAAIQSPHQRVPGVSAGSWPQALPSQPDDPLNQALSSIKSTATHTTVVVCTAAALFVCPGWGPHARPHRQHGCTEGGMVPCKERSPILICDRADNGDDRWCTIAIRACSAT